MEQFFNFNGVELACATESEFDMIMDRMGLDPAVDPDPVNGVGYLAIRNAEGNVEVHEVFDWPTTRAAKEVWFVVPATSDPTRPPTRTPRN